MRMEDLMKFYLSLKTMCESVPRADHLVLTRSSTYGTDLVLSYGESFIPSHGFRVTLADSTSAVKMPTLRSAQLVLNLGRLGWDAASSAKIQKKLATSDNYLDNSPLTGDESVMISPLAVCHLIEGGCYGRGAVVASWAETNTTYSYLFGAAGNAFIRFHTDTDDRDYNNVALVNLAIMQERNMNSTDDAYGVGSYLPGSSSKGHRNWPARGVGATSNFKSWDKYSMWALDGSYRSTHRGSSFKHAIPQVLGGSALGDLCLRLALVTPSQKAADDKGEFEGIEAYGLKDVDQAVTAKNSNALSACLATYWANIVCSRLQVDIADVRGDPGHGESMSPTSLAASFIVFSKKMGDAKTATTEGLGDEDGKKLSLVETIGISCRPRNSYDYSSNVLKIYKGPYGSTGSITQGKPIDQRFENDSDKGWGGNKEGGLWYQDYDWNFPNSGPDIKSGFRLPKYVTGVDSMQSDNTKNSLDWVPLAYPIARAYIVDHSGTMEVVASKLAESDRYSKAVSRGVDHIADSALQALVADMKHQCLIFF